MGKRIIISEEEKKEIRNLYNLNENLIDDVITFVKDKGGKVIDKIGDFFGIEDEDEEDKDKDEKNDKEKDLEKSVETEVSKMSPEEIEKFSKMVKYDDVKIKVPDTEVKIGSVSL